MKIQSLVVAILAVLMLTVSACGTTSSSASAEPRLVLVAGATGGTGRALVNNLLTQNYSVRAFVRDEAKARVVLGDKVSYAEGDVRDMDSIVPAMTGVAYVISAIGSTRADPDNGPEAVDFGGIRNLANAAAAAGVKQFVLVSSSGVTHEDHFLNKIMNNVLIWKFKGENALRESGVPYTIVRPGGLLNVPGGSQALVFAQGDTTSGTISREDVALICIAALSHPAAVGKTFETYAEETPGENDWAGLFQSLQAD